MQMRTIIVTQAERDAYMQSCMSNFPSLTPSLMALCHTQYMRTLLLSRWNSILRHMGQRTLQIHADVSGGMEFVGTRQSLVELLHFVEQKRWGPFSKENSASAASE